MTDVPFDPPALKAPDVLAHRRRLEAQLVELRSSVPAAALAAVNKKFGSARAPKVLAALRRKIANIEFSLAANRDAYDLAKAKDAAGHAAWRADVLSLPAEKLVEGIGADSCCRRCRPGTQGGCVITSPHPYAGSVCGHPIREMQSIFGRDSSGDRQFMYRDNARAAQIFDIARTKLKVPTR